MMPTGLVYSPRFQEHDTGANHPERPARLAAIVERLKADGLWERLVHLPFGPVDMQWILRIHDRDYVDRLLAACRAGDPHIDTVDSAICPASAEIAQLAVGGAVAAADAVMRQEVENAFCALRPPGHHAERDRSMGFCLYNNIAIAAEYLVSHHGLQRVAIVDFDVHHGNGTQHAFESRGDVLFISMHEDPAFLYPGTGSAEEVGRGAGRGATVNCPLHPGSGDATCRQRFKAQVMPALNGFHPQFLLVDAGFDAAGAVPLVKSSWASGTFAWMTAELKAAAEKHCDGRLVSFREGGYNLQSLARCAADHVRVLLGEPLPEPEPEPHQPDEEDEMFLGW